MRKVYADNAATTALSEKVLNKWIEYSDIELKENSHGHYIAVTTSYYMKICL